LSIFQNELNDYPIIQAIDIFCGIGGLTYGIQASGINVIAGLDNDITCKYSFESNNNSKFIHSDITQCDFSALKMLFNKDTPSILIGCAPCQPFSSHSFKRIDREKDDRWSLIDKFADAISVILPDAISMENVPGLAKTQVFEKFVKRIEDFGYVINYKVLYCPDYGIPQRRSRLVLFASKLGKIGIPPPTHTKKEYVTVRDAIGKLPVLRAGSTSKIDHLHRAMNLSEINKARIKASKPNGTWRDWDKELLPECYKKESGNSYTAVYGRMAWDDVSPTITTQFYNYGSGRFGHPSQSRALSIREGSLLQTFPADYEFDTDLSFVVLGRQIGNAVPPMLGRIIGEALKEHIYAR